MADSDLIARAEVVMDRAEARLLSSSTDVERLAVLEAVNEAGRATRNGWVFFVAMMAFFWVAIAGVSHRDLFLNAPIRLPFLTVEIPLTAFFTFGPVIFVLLHLRLILQHVMLARKIHALHENIARDESGSGERTHAVRKRVITYIYTQMIAGPDRDIWFNVVLQVITIATLIALPLLLLLYFQIQFLPVHDAWITGLHQILVVIDAAFVGGALAALFPSWSMWGTTRRRAAQYVFARVIPNVVIGLSFLSSLFVLTIPDSPLDKLANASGLTARVPFAANAHRAPPSDDKRREVFLPTAYLLESEVNFISGVSTSWSGFSRNLILPNLKFHPAKTAETGLDLRGRDLRYATLDNSDLSFADLTGADLTGASLVRVNLTHAKLVAGPTGRTPAELALDYGKKSFDAEKTQDIEAYIAERKSQGYDTKRDKKDPVIGGKTKKVVVVSWWVSKDRLQPARLAGANLTGADLTNADLTGAEGQDAKFSAAKIVNTNFENGQFDKASFYDALVRNARFKKTKLFGASFVSAIIDGTMFDGAKATLASFQAALIARTKFESVRLVVSDFSSARIVDTDISSVDFHGANFHGATIVGTDLSGGVFHGAHFGEAMVWNSKPPTPYEFRYAGLRDVKVAIPKNFVSLIDWMGEASHQAERQTRREKLKREHLGDAAKAWAQSDDHAQWTAGISEAKAVPIAAFRQGLSSYYGRLVCSTSSKRTAEALVSTFLQGWVDVGGFWDEGSYWIGGGDLKRAVPRSWDELGLPANADVYYLIGADSYTADSWYSAGGTTGWIPEYDYPDLDPEAFLAALRRNDCEGGKRLSKATFDKLEKDIAERRERATKSK